MSENHRAMCFVCLQPKQNCYCSAIERFDPGIKFIILIHPIEARRRIATGRMSHLCLVNSELIRGEDFSKNERVNDILQDKTLFPVLLYPGEKSRNLTTLSAPEREHLFPKDKKAVVFVVDGTWNTARKMMRLSHNLRALPQICFTPAEVSNFRVRKQPHPYCYSTIEAIHKTLELLGKNFGQERLLNVFNTMVERQLTYIKNPKLKELRPTS